MSKYQRPVLMLNEVRDKEGNITWEGSARGYDKSEMKDFRAFLEESGLATGVGQKWPLNLFPPYQWAHLLKIS